MALNHSPKIVTDGLVFAYDMANTQKSWKGAPTTNLYGDFSTSSALRTNTQHFTNGAGWVTSGYADPGAPSPGFYLGKVYKFVSGSINSTWSGNSYGYMYKDIASTNGQAYTMSFWAYVSPDCNITALPASVETTTGYAAANLPGTYDLTKKGTWQRIGASSTGVGTTTRWLAYPQRTGVTDGSFSGYFLIAGMQVETGTFATPYTDNTRSNTQALIDLTGTNTITASSLTYASDGTFSFNGSNNYISIPTSSTLNFSSVFTLETWLNPNTYTGDIIILGQGSYYLTMNSLYQLSVYCYGKSPAGYHTTTETLTKDSWNHICAAWSTTEVSLYINGEFKKSVSTTGTPNSVNTQVWIGSEYNGTARPFNGRISSAKIYNRALTAAEVKQNFNALRGRYGI